MIRLLHKPSKFKNLSRNLPNKPLVANKDNYYFVSYETQPFKFSNKAGHSMFKNRSF